MGVDFGDQHVGLAVTDVGRSMVFGRGELKGYKRLEELFERIMGVCQEEEIVEVVFGVPAGKEGEETAQSRRLRDIGERLEQYLGTIPVVFQDESFSSFEADAAGAEWSAGGGPHAQAGPPAGAARKLHKKYSRHELAAMVILERYLEREDW